MFGFKIKTVASELFIKHQGRSLSATDINEELQRQQVGFSSDYHVKQADTHPHALLFKKISRAYAIKTLESLNIHRVAKVGTHLDKPCVYIFGVIALTHDAKNGFRVFCYSTEKQKFVLCSKTKRDVQVLPIASFTRTMFINRWRGFAISKFKEINQGLIKDDDYLDIANHLNFNFSRALSKNDQNGKPNGFFSRYLTFTIYKTLMDKQTYSLLRKMLGPASVAGMFLRSRSFCSDLDFLNIYQYNKALKNKECLLKIEKERPNAVNILKFIDDKYWLDDRIFSKKYWRDEKGGLVDLPIAKNPVIRQKVVGQKPTMAVLTTKTYPFVLSLSSSEIACIFSFLDFTYSHEPPSDSYGQMVEQTLLLYKEVFYAIKNQEKRKSAHFGFIPVSKRLLLLDFLLAINFILDRSMPHLNDVAKNTLFRFCLALYSLVKPMSIKSREFIGLAQGVLLNDIRDCLAYYLIQHRQQGHSILTNINKNTSWQWFYDLNTDFHVNIIGEATYIEQKDLTWSPLLTGELSWRFDDCTIVELLSSKELRDEGYEQEHCVGISGYDVLCHTGKLHIFSITNNDERTTLSVHYAGSQIVVEQHRGQRNQNPSKQREKVTESFIKYLNDNKDKT